MDVRHPLGRIKYSTNDMMPATQKGMLPLKKNCNVRNNKKKNNFQNPNETIIKKKKLKWFLFKKEQHAKKVKLFFVFRARLTSLPHIVLLCRV